MPSLDKFLARVRVQPSYVPPATRQEARHGVASVDAVEGARAKRRKSIREVMRNGEVGWSHDLSRVLALPRRQPFEAAAIQQTLTARLKTPGGTQTLRPIQAMALWEAPQVGGMLGNIGVGEGKELIGFLMPMVFSSCQRAVLLIPAALRAQVLADYERYAQHWVLPNLAGGKTFVAGRPVLHVVSYSEVSSMSQPKLLKLIGPDLVMANECHNLKNFGSSRVVRFLDYFDVKPDTRFCGWSGTITSNSIRDYCHLAILALGGDAPVPTDTTTVDEWAAALDPPRFGQAQYDGGALETAFCRAGESVRSGYARRLTDTRGIIATSESTLGVALNILERPAPEMPQVLKDDLRILRRKPADGGWVRPDGEELTEAMQVGACARELACGFYYSWRFLSGTDDEIDEWFAARQDYNRELRARLQEPRPHLDSPGLCWEAAARWFDGGCRGCGRGPGEYHEPHCGVKEELPLWNARTFLYWRDVEPTVTYEPQATWRSDFLLDDIQRWAAESPGVVWVEHAEVGRRLQKDFGLVYFGGGPKAAEAIVAEDGRRSIVASIDAHGTGRNMQMFNRNLFVCPPSNGKVAEQLIGRTHRQGQLEDEVTVEMFRHTAELRAGLVKAIGEARYTQETTNSSQRLCYGTFGFQP